MFIFIFAMYYFYRKENIATPSVNNLFLLTKYYIKKNKKLII